MEEHTLPLPFQRTLISAMKINLNLLETIEEISAAVLANATGNWFLVGSDRGSRPPLINSRMNECISGWMDG